MTIDEVIEAAHFRRQVYDIVPEGTKRILDFGCADGALLLRLRRDKGCSEIYGIEVEQVDGQQHLDGHWLLDIQDEDLGEEYHGFFNYIIMHDVLEHLHDPWYVLSKLRKYLADDGKLVVVVPNIQFFKFIGDLLRGIFEYGEEGGLMNKGHLRWFTAGSLIETLMLTGFAVQKIIPLCHPLAVRNDIVGGLRELTVPPVAYEDTNGRITIQFPYDITGHYNLYVAKKIMCVCTKGEESYITKPTKVDSIKNVRAGLPESASQAIADAIRQAIDLDKGKLW